MNKQIEKIKNTRVYLTGLVKDLSVDQLNEIPQNFNNNIAWNLAHLVAVQQGICYTRAGVKTAVDESLITSFRPGTKPEQYMDYEQMEMWKELLLSSLDKLDADYQNKIFSNYTSFTTRYGVSLENIDDAIEFLSYHEGFHTGAVMAIKNCLAS